MIVLKLDHRRTVTSAGFENLVNYDSVKTENGLVLIVEHIMKEI